MKPGQSDLMQVKELKLLSRRDPNLEGWQLGQPPHPRSPVFPHSAACQRNAEIAPT